MSPVTTASHERLATFACTVEPALLQAAGKSVQALENHLAASLSGCVRLIRWAIVAVDPQGNAHVEGAYLHRG